ncbi:hypothetical protein AgCh_007358 [Apium graveolens]
MRSSGKENSMPYQVISRAMETVINQHGLDIDALTSSRIPLTTGTQVADSASSQFAGSSLRGAVAMEANTSLVSGDLRNDSYASNRPPVGPSFTGHDIYQGSVSHLNSKSLDHESPSSFDTRSAKSHSEEKHDSPNWEKAKKKDNKKSGSKRKKADPPSNSESQFGNIQPLESSTFSSGMDKAATKMDQPRNISIQASEHGQFNNMVQSSSMTEHNSMRSALRAKQEIQHQAEKSLDSTNISNSLSRTPHSRHPEEIEVSSAHNALSRQGVSLPVAHDVLNSRGTWNQTKTGTPFEKSQVPRFSFNTTGGNLSGETLLHQSAGAAGTGYGMAISTSGAYATTVPGLPGSVQFSNTYDTSSLGPKMNKDRNMESFDLPSDKSAFGNALEYEGGSIHTSGNDSSLVQGGMLNNVTEMAAHRSTGKLPVSQFPSAPIMPFKEQHLKQLRAQCLVYLAFRNGLKPKKLHLDFALGNFSPKEEGPSKDMIEQKEKEQSFDGTSNTSDVPTPYGRLGNLRESDNLRLDPSSVGMLADVKLTKGEYINRPGEKNGMPSGPTEYGEERRQIMIARRKPDSEIQTGEIVQSQLSAKGVNPDGLSSRSSPRNHKDDLDNRHQQVRSIDQASSVMGMRQQLQTEVTGQSGNSCDEEASNLSLQSLAALNESVPERKDNTPNQSYSLADRNFQGSQPADAYLPSVPSSAHWKPLSRTDVGNLMVSPDDSKISHKNYSGSVGSIRIPSDNALLIGNPFLLGDTVHEEEDASVATDFPPSPKYTTTEKWIADQQKRKLFTEKTWALKQQRTQQRITACSEKLKDNVSSSEDISAKTRSVIELKKLQLLELQRRLRKDILNDFFRPIASEMDRLKSIKKHRIGRRSKQLEKYEQKMKEERQKRFRERQKEFFSEIEIHKERLEDVFKMRRERWKGFNRSVREFHKRKERIHREKIDRIQREKINLLKINDVEGYLRMVQDAKSDRVKQLLKETEKYLQKLGSKLRDAKAMSRCFETDMDESRSAGVVEKNDMITDNEDETDQAKHYLESNEKYYLMAHSIKENVAEQPSCLVGGKLREYQMNGLRWLVSLYNNHLNGILADEMGLGKTVQVISLICYLMENKNDRGPFLVVVPSSVLPGWDSEINFWAPSINKIVYSGPPEERRRLFKERIVPQKFNVLLTTYEYLMNKHDRPKLSKIHWHYVIIDEGHRIKNASCKLNADLKLYHSSHRLLLTGTPLQNNLEELWALLNFLLPNIFNSSEDFSQWFNKPFESNGDSSPDEALLSEEENLLIINRLHQVLRPFVLRRLKHKVENELPEKIERLVRCEASAYQKLLMKRVEDNLGALGTSKARSVHNSVMELRNICNHPYLSQLHSEEVHDYIPKHYLPNIVRLCGKLEMLDRILPKLKATDHRVLLFSTMTRLLDVMEDYLYWKQYKYLRLDGHTSGGDRGALIDQYNKPDSPYFIFLLSIRAGGVGVNLQAADTVIIFDTDWNPQVDLQAQARAHRIGQKREVLVLRFETVQTVEEQVRAAAEHKLGVANQSITAGFFDNNTSAEDRREYLESLLRESKKEEAAPVLHDDAVNDLIARSESEIDIFESIDKRREEEEMTAWKLALGGRANSSELVQTLPSRLVTAEELKAFSEAMKIYDAPSSVTVSNIGGIKRKSGYLGGLDTQHYGRGKRAREVRSYEEQWTEDEFEKLCQAESPHSPKMKDEVKEMNLPMVTSEKSDVDVKAEMMVPSDQPTQPPLVQSVQPTLPLSMKPSVLQSVQHLVNTTEPPLVQSAQSLVAQSSPLQQAPHSPVEAAYSSVSLAGNTPIMQPTQRSKETAPKRGRGRPKRITQISPSHMTIPSLSETASMSMESRTGTVSSSFVEAGLHQIPSSAVGNSFGTIQQSGGIDTSQALSTLPSASPNQQPIFVPCPIPVPDKRRGRKGQSGGETPQRKGRKPIVGASTTPVLSPSHETDNLSMVSKREIVCNMAAAPVPSSPPVKGVDKETGSVSVVPVLLPSEKFKPTCAETSSPEQNDTSSQQNPRLSSVTPVPQSVSPSQVVPKQVKGRGSKTQNENETPRRRGRKQIASSTAVCGGSGGQELTSTEPPQKKSRVSSSKTAVAKIEAVKTVENESCKSLINTVASPTEVTGDTQSSECQSPRSDCQALGTAPLSGIGISDVQTKKDVENVAESGSENIGESLPLTQSTFQALGTAPLSGIGISDVQTKKDVENVAESGSENIGEPYRSPEEADHHESIENIQATSATLVLEVAVKNRINLASSTLDTDQALDAGKKCGEKLALDAEKKCGEKSVDKKDCNVGETDDSMVENRESLHNYKEGALTGCTEDNKQGGENVAELTNDSKDELMHDLGSAVQSSARGGEGHEDPHTEHVAEEGALTGCTEDNKKGGENIAESGSENIGEPYRSPEADHHESIENIQATSATLVLEVEGRNRSKFASSSMETDQALDAEKKCGEKLALDAEKKCGEKSVDKKYCNVGEVDDSMVQGGENVAELTNNSKDELMHELGSAVQSSTGGGEGHEDLHTEHVAEEGALTGCIEDDKKGGENVAESGSENIGEPYRSPEEADHHESIENIQATSATSILEVAVRNRSKFASSSMETDQALDAEKKCDEKLALDAEKKCGEKSVDKKDCNVEEAHDLMVENRESLYSSEEGALTGCTGCAEDNKQGGENVAELTKDSKDELMHELGSTVQSSTGGGEGHEDLHTDNVTEEGALTGCTGDNKKGGGNVAESGSQTIGEPYRSPEEADHHESIENIQATSATLVLEVAVRNRSKLASLSMETDQALDAENNCGEKLALDDEKKCDEKSIDKKDCNVGEADNLMVEDRESLHSYEEGVLTGCTEDNKQGGESVAELTKDSKDELMHELGSAVQSSTGGGEGHEDLHTERVAEEGALTECTEDNKKGGQNVAEFTNDAKDELMHEIGSEARGGEGHEDQHTEHVGE